jgi:hypothetical protein
MRKCPNISPNPYEIEGTIHACHDFQKINSLASTIIEKYSVYEANKHKLNDDFFDGADYVEMCGETYQEKLQELRDYIKKRSAENWR